MEKVYAWINEEGELTRFEFKKMSAIIRGFKRYEFDITKSEKKFLENRAMKSGYWEKAELFFKHKWEVKNGK